MKGVLVLDFGSQYTQLIARRIRELGVYSEIRPCTVPFSEFKSDFHWSAVILSGGPSSVTAEDAPPFDLAWLEIEQPILGVCYGMQLLSEREGGTLASGVKREYGHAALEITEESPLFAGFDRANKTSVWMSHGDHVEVPPPGYSVIAKSAGLPVAAIGCDEKRRYGLQFHPEVVHTPKGSEILANFVFEIARCEKNWTSEDFIGRCLASVRSEVDKDAKVVCGLSGGVDSSVAAVLVNKALGGELHCIFVDNGLLRADEVQEVTDLLGGEELGLNIQVSHSEDRFLQALKGVRDPEKKRKIIGEMFIKVFEEESEKLGNVSHLVQGTLYPDVIESLSVRGPSATIKTHHNVGGLPERMNLKLIEPFRELFKDEVRAIGRELGLPSEILLRQPFPGPGLAVRVLGEVTKERLTVLRKADRIFMEEIRAEGLYEQIWQSFVVLLPVSSVGVMGDNRTYEETAGLRAVYSQDGMTADWVYLPEDLLRRTANRIINEVRGINRVVLDVSSKPPATIEWE